MYIRKFFDLYTVVDNEAYVFDRQLGKLNLQESIIYDGQADPNSPWFYRSIEMREDQRVPISEPEALGKIDSYTHQEIESIINSKTLVCFICEEFDANRTLEGFGITGNNDGWNLNDVKIYYVSSNGVIVPVDDFSSLHGYGGEYFDASYTMEYNIIDSAKFFVIGGIDGQETWIYGVKGDTVYQPEVSEQHANFSKTEEGMYCAQPHEGGPGYYEFNPDTGEFVRVN